MNIGRMRQRDDENGSPSGAIFNAHGAAVGLDKALDDGQPHAGSESAAGTGRDPIKLIKDCSVKMPRYPCAQVSYRHIHKS